MWWAFWLRLRSQRSSGASCERSRILGWLPRAIGSPRALDWHFRKIVPWSVSCCHHSASKRPSPVTSPLLSPGVLFKPDFAWYFSKSILLDLLQDSIQLLIPLMVTFLPWFVCLSTLVSLFPSDCPLLVCHNILFRREDSHVRAAYGVIQVAVLFLPQAFSHDPLGGCKINLMGCVRICKRMKQ